jgi:hypothetical protein
MAPPLLLYSNLGSGEPLYGWEVIEPQLRRASTLPRRRADESHSELDTVSE